ncbi:DUF305 domain-containing protein [Pseudoflavitalea sp. G-6-1-2]|uniref:DUF305 domain-containing protein n=1 Tax=Pseudoflavitalea sp. G-6-1-2 TaxID=2728841 RepID=UPI001469E2B1|nr:DUF305 domain-containing protein [Pseudoflavitalea sp. G-6-1-2]NML21349.1 DUF305 domain-containing protein [Pseudoflavitalea sp. G-6-1-2]
MNTETYHDNPMMQAMHSMAEEMHHASMHGDPDHHFCRMMQLHHAGAINMGNLVIEEGNNQTIAELAGAIIQKQKDEIAAMQVYLNSHHSMPHSEHAAFNSAMRTVMDKMEQQAASEELTGDIDHDFAVLMVHHHQAAIEMADLIIQYGSDAGIKKMAGEIRIDQEAEVEALLKWLNERRQAEFPS